MNEGWTWAQLEEDGYVGYLASDAIGESAVPPTHIIDVPSTFLYPVPNIKSQPVVALPLNGAVSVVEEDERFARLAGGSVVFRKHLRKAGTFSKGFVSIAEQFLHVPYLWGGKSAAGLDCSGLVQLSLQAAGIPSPRDSDMQEEALGLPLSKDDLSNLRRGDLVFWDGHVGIMTDPAHLLHANGFHMQVIREPLHEAVDRITAMYGHITSIKRL
jgi:cell wall-associated NlpC family hydrolase